MPSINNTALEIFFNCKQIEQSCDRLVRLQKILERKITNRQQDNLQNIVSDYQDAIKIIRRCSKVIENSNDTIRRFYE